MFYSVHFIQILKLKTLKDSVSILFDHTSLVKSFIPYIEHQKHLKYK